MIIIYCGQNIIKVYKFKKTIDNPKKITYNNYTNLHM